MGTQDGILGGTHGGMQDGSQGGNQGGDIQSKESNIRWGPDLDKALARCIATNYSKWLIGPKIHLSKQWAREIGVGLQDPTGTRTKAHILQLLDKYNQAKDMEGSTGLLERQTIANGKVVTVVLSVKDQQREKCPVWNILNPAISGNRHIAALDKGPGLGEKSVLGEIQPSKSLGPRSKEELEVKTISPNSSMTMQNGRPLSMTLQNASSASLSKGRPKQSTSDTALSPLSNLVRANEKATEVRGIEQRGEARQITSHTVPGTLPNLARLNQIVTEERRTDYRDQLMVHGNMGVHIPGKIRRHGRWEESENLTENSGRAPSPTIVGISQKEKRSCSSISASGRFQKGNTKPSEGHADISGGSEDEPAPKRRNKVPRQNELAPEISQVISLLADETALEKKKIEAAMMRYKAKILEHSPEAVRERREREQFRQKLDMEKLHAQKELIYLKKLEIASQMGKSVEEMFPGAEVPGVGKGGPSRRGTPKDLGGWT